MIYIASGHIGTVHPLDHPRFCFHTHTGTYTATNSAAGANVAWMGDGETWSQWAASSGNVNVTLTFPAARAIDYIGIAAHDLDVAGSTVAVQIDTGSGFADVPGLTGIQPTDDSAILFFLGPVDVVAARLVITGDTAPKIAVFQAGLSMELPRKCTYTALPISESEQVQYRHARSVQGQVIGTVVEAAGLSFSIDVAHLSEAWRQADGVNSWQAFIAHLRNVGPFFVASRPSRYPDDVAYGVAQDRPRFNRQIPNHTIAGAFSVNFLGYKRP